MAKPGEHCRCIAQLATSFQDPGLLAQARTMYNKSLQYLSFRMQNLDFQVPDKAQLNDILICLHALTSCAWFKCCASTDDMEWLKFTHTTLKTHVSTSLTFVTWTHSLHHGQPE